jgi:hypothetical protein
VKAKENAKSAEKVQMIFPSLNKTDKSSPIDRTVSLQWQACSASLIMINCLFVDWRKRGRIPTVRSLANGLHLIVPFRWDELKRYIVPMSVRATPPLTTQIPFTCKYLKQLTRIGILIHHFTKHLIENNRNSSSSSIENSLRDLAIEVQCAADPPSKCLPNHKRSPMAVANAMKYPEITLFGFELDLQSDTVTNPSGIPFPSYRMKNGRVSPKAKSMTMTNPLFALAIELANTDISSKLTIDHHGRLVRQEVLQLSHPHDLIV